MKLHIVEITIISCIVLIVAATAYKLVDCSRQLDYLQESCEFTGNTTISKKLSLIGNVQVWHEELAYEYKCPDKIVWSEYEIK